MLISRYFVYFIIFSALGWVYESTVMTIYSKKWSNRGFLFGPVCPIYGIGAVGGTLLFTYWMDPAMEAWKLFLFFSLSTAILEFTTSYVLERWFHARWWDYSKAPLNIQGRICVPASAGFGIAGILFVRYALPFIKSLDRFDHPLLLEGLSLFFMLVLALDIALTLSSLTDLVSRIESVQSGFDGMMEDRYAKLQESSSSLASNVKSRIIVAGQGLTEKLKKLPVANRISFLQLQQVSSIRYFHFKGGKESKVLKALKTIFGFRHKNYTPTEEPKAEKDADTAGLKDEKK
ncbi:MAG: putative ABC transporter permease [Lachnospiraceae bacterium]|nr:putative ABC transporter permease [Lachnospiraceae bacterium]